MSDLMSTVPPHITRFLVLSAPVLAWARKAAEVLLWRDAGSRAWSWAVVAAWWIGCLSGSIVLRFLLPPVVLLIVLFPCLPTVDSFLPPRFQRHRSASPAVATSPITVTGRPSPRIDTSASGASTSHLAPASTQSVQVAVANFSAVTTLVFQHWPPQWFLEVREEVRRPGGWRRVARGLTGVWVLWVFGNLLLGVRVMLALVGTVVLLSPSPYLPPIARAFRSSFLLTQIWLFLELLVIGPSAKSTAYGSRSSDQSLIRWAWTRSSVRAREASTRAQAENRGRSASMKTLLGTIKRSLSKMPTDTLSDNVPPNSNGNSSVAKAEAINDEWDEEPVVFRFEVMENQRWWLALDWTSTLAPSDRPIWCDTHLHPTPAPPQFVLPPSHTITIPHPPNEQFNEVRIATWRWAEDDWSVLRSVDHSNPKGPTFVPTKVANADGSSGASPLPAGASQKEVNAVGSTAGPAAMSPSSRMSLGEQALSRGLERLKAATASATSNSTPASGSSAAGNSPSAASASNASTSPTRATSGSLGRSSLDGGERKTLFAMSLGATGPVGAGSGADEDSYPVEENKEVEDLGALTDEAGWSYGGNKWESMGPKGGLGKFTRRRRWVRLAVLEEHVHLFPKSYVLPQPPSAPSPASVQDLEETGAPSPTLIGSTVAGTADSSTTARLNDVGGGSLGAASGPSEALRLRLKKAVEKGR